MPRSICARPFNHSKLYPILAFSLITTTLYISLAGSWIPPWNTFPLTHNLNLPETEDVYRLPPERIEQYFPPPNPQRKDYREWNAQTLRELHVCMAIENCRPRQQKIALLAAHWFEEAIVRGFRGGEGIWGMSVYKHLRGLGYTTLFADTFEEALSQYRMFPDLVKVVIRNKAGECHSDPNCVKGPSNPSGIPAWKIFDFEYFPSHGTHFHSSLLKGKWILSAVPDDNRHLSNEKTPVQYIGYSIEDDCQKIPFVPFEERADQAWLLMKQLTYAYDDHFAWNRSYFSLTAQETKINMVGGWQVDQHYFRKPETQGIMQDIEDHEHGVFNYGKLDQTNFMEQLGQSKVMIGIGNPWWSPSPLNALCQGVPFINPIRTWDENDPWNRLRWQSQHPSLSQYDPPYVYNVHARNWEGFVSAIKQATSTPIDRFIPDHMREQAVRDRLETFMETDWRAKAVRLLDDRRKELEAGVKDVYLFEL